MHVAVVGGGIFGLVIAWRLSLRGHMVTLIEPLGPGNASSASGDRSRIVRALYDEPCFAEAGRVGLELWAAWSRELGARLVEPVGVVYCDQRGGEPRIEAFRTWLDRGVANVRALGAVAEELEPAEAARRWPALFTGDLRRVVFEPEGGFGRPALACRAIARAALATGKVRFVAAAVERIELAGGVARGVWARARDASSCLVEADVTVVAAGLGGAALFSALGIDLGIRRIPHFTSYWDVPWPDGADLMMGRLPAWVDLGVGLYGFPDDGDNGFKVAWHEPRREGEASEAGEAGDEALEALRTAASLRFPALRSATPRGTYACAYDATPDEMFRIGPAPEIGNLYFVGGMSGHGYKHAPSLGESVAALVVGEAPRVDLAPYALIAASSS